MSGRSYDLLKHNCHIAQEATRIHYGFHYGLDNGQKLSYPKQATTLAKSLKE